MGPLLLLFACSKFSKKNVESIPLFYGECRLNVSATPKGATIKLDGVKLGYGSQKLQVPCGEKKVVVYADKHYTTEKYVTVTRAEALNLKINLKKMQKTTNYALSQNFLNDVAQKKRWTLSMNKSKEAEAATGSSEVIDGDPTTVDFWR